jgi:hypothetical protein
MENKKVIKYENNTISKEYRKLLKKITFNWGVYKQTDFLEIKANLIFYLNFSKELVDTKTRAEILKQNYYFN